MKSRSFLFLLAFLIGTFLCAGTLLYADEDRFNTEVIKEYDLDPNTVYNIPIGNTATTITFPGPLLSIDGANISASPSNQAPVLLSYVAGHYFFSVRATQPKAQAAVNVVYRNQTYAFNFYHREETQPYRSVKLLSKAEAPAFAGTASSGQVHRKVSPKILVELLDQAKSYQVIEAAYPGKLAHIDYRVPEELVTEYRDFRVTVDEVFRFDSYDTLVFRIQLQNKTEETIFYQPQTVAVRIGSNLYFPSIADASGIIPPSAASTAYVAITGKPNGERADLSVRNRFQIVVSRIQDPAKLVIP